MVYYIVVNNFFVGFEISGGSYDRLQNLSQKKNSRNKFAILLKFVHFLGHLTTREVPQTFSLS